MLARGLLVLAVAAVSEAATCGGYTCSAGFQAKTVPITPVDCPATGCTDAICCNALCSNSNFQCSPTTIKKNPTPTLCHSEALPGLLASCQDTCCEARKTCDGFACSAGYTRRTNAAAVVCQGSKASDCYDGICCEATCGHSSVDVCPAASKAKAAATICGASLQDCTEAKCCDAPCTTFRTTCQSTVGYDWVAPTVAKYCSSYNCGVAATELETCCVKTCKHTTHYTCDASNHRYRPSSLANALVCTDTNTGLSTCEAKCCVESCAGQHARGCGANKYNINANERCPGAGMNGGDCTIAQCCADTCGGFGGCPAAFMFPVPTPDNVHCPVLGGCSTSLCCENSCHTITGKMCDPTHTEKPEAARKAQKCHGSACNYNAACCEPTCRSFSCTGGFTDAVFKSVRTCSSGPGGVCNEAHCCTPNCANTGAPACAAGTLSRGSGTLCTGDTPATNCAIATCCQATCVHADVTACPADYKLKVTPAPATIRCSGFSGTSCTQGQCCNSMCSLQACSKAAGWQDKSGKADIVCGITPGDCTPEKCCDALCSNTAFSCSTHFQKKTNAAELKCPSTHQTCTDNLCCDAKCSHPDFACAVGWTKKTTAAATVCVDEVPARCTDDKCCDVLCSNEGWACSAGFHKKALAGQIRCGADKSDCTDTLCCDATCSNTAFACDTNYLKKATAAKLVCGDLADKCTNAFCCDAACSHNSFVCDIKFLKKTNGANITCGGKVDEACKTETCCDEVTAAGTSARLSLSRQSCCDSNADCTANGDAAAVCQTGSAGCKCSAFFEHKTDAQGNVISLCFPKPNVLIDLSVTIGLRASGTGDAAACGDDLSGELLTVVTDFTKASLQGTIYAHRYRCSGASSSTHTQQLFTLSLPAAQKTALIGHRDVAGNFQSASVDALKAAILKAMVDASNSAQLHNLELVRQDRGNSFELTIGATTGSAADDGSATPCTPTNGVRGVRSTFGSSTCIPTVCSPEHVLQTPSSHTTVSCSSTLPVTQPCVHDGDCMYDAVLPADKRKSICGYPAKECTIPALETLTPCKNSGVRVALSVDKDWCSSDANCQAYGDSDARCNKNAGLGNWCMCGSNSTVAGVFTPLCFAKNAVPTHVKLSYSINFGKSLLCPVNSQQLAEMRRLVSDVIGPIINVREVCTSSGLQFLGDAQVPIPFLNTLATSSGTYLSELLRAALGAGSTADRLAAPEAQPFPALAGGLPVSASVGTLFQCALTGAVSTRLDVHNRCQAISCDADHVFHSSQGVASCVNRDQLGVLATPVPVVVQNEESDDGLTNGEKIGIAFAVVGVVALIILIVAFVMSRGSSAPASAPKDEPETNEPTNEEA
eukprot:Rhum_TRINITY_DN14946_c3_g1::Rhum_TRINITY_DN14946_c3_g1_i1::g.132372::m.132372